MTAFFSPLADTGIPVARNDEASISFAMGVEMATQWQLAHPDKPIVLAEVGWPNHTEVKSGRTDPWVKGVLSVDPKAKDLGCLDAGSGTDAARQVMLDLVARHPEVNLIYSEAANLTVGTMAALAQVGRGKFNNGQPLTEIVASVDFDEDEMRSVYDPNSSLKLSMGLPPLETARGRIDLIMDIAADKVAPISQPAQEFFYKAHNISYWTTRAESAREHSKTHLDDKTVRTSVERLDSLMNLVGELITDRNRLYQFRGEFESRFRGDAQVDTLADIATHIGHITDQLQEEVVRIRMLPLATVFNKFPRLVRDLAHQSAKQAELVIQGEGTELDRAVIEEINDPLLHLLRHAIDHGLETPEQRRAAGKPERGTVMLTARHDGNRIMITVEDDGHGIDAGEVRASAVRKGLLSEAEAAALTDDESIQLIFRSGLSSVNETGDISGGGEGLDVVRASVERLNGTIRVETQPGRGTQFRMAFPLTLAIVPALLVDVGSNTFAIPLASVVEAHRIPVSAIHTLNGRLVIQLRGQVLPLVRLSQALGAELTADQPPNAREYMVAVRWGKTEMGLIVEKLVGKQELVIKSLGALGGEILGVSGAAILGDGRVALIVDVPGLFRNLS
jgi:two-component system chemotaxis sensor kinase CheA